MVCSTIFKRGSDTKLVIQCLSSRFILDYYKLKSAVELVPHTMLAHILIMLSHYEAHPIISELAEINSQTIPRAEKWVEVGRELPPFPLLKDETVYQDLYPVI